MDKANQLTQIFKIGIFNEAELIALGVLSDQTGLSPYKILLQGLRLYQLEANGGAPDFSKLASEIERLKEGDFSDEEFQNLCHCIPDEDREAFFTGCANYQRRLFGQSDRDRHYHAIRGLFDLLTRDSQGRWCFKSLSRDEKVFDRVINELYALLDTKGN